MKMILEANAEAEAKALLGGFSTILQNIEWVISFIFVGEALGFAIAAKGKAEADQMALKAKAFSEYKEAAIADMVLQVRFHFIFLLLIILQDILANVRV